MFLAHLPSVAVMALDRRVLKEGDALSYMQIHVPMFLTIVKVNFWTVTVTSQQLVHINNFNCLL
jgi:hypothetical protein